MKYLFSLVLIFFTIHLSAQSDASSYKEENGEVHLLGAIELQDLQTHPYKSWYDSIYQAYQIDQNSLDIIDKHYDERIKLKVFLGTWCGDSKREVSRLYKIAAQSKLNPQDIELICLDARRDQYKQGPNREEKGYNIHRVPTFIFTKNNKELARIVEYPVNSLELDIAQIFAGLPSEPNYRLANQIGNLFDRQTTVEVDSFLNQQIDVLKEKKDSEYELTTYGSVLLFSDQVDKAKVVLKFNEKLFPKSGYTQYCLGRIHMINDEPILASEYFLKSIQLDPKLKYGEERIMELIGKKFAE